MLSFLQKYQKAFFIFVTFLIIASFAFAGVFETYMAYESTQKDRKVAENIDGSAVMLSTVQNISRFIATDRNDLVKGIIPNLCNDGVIRNDLLATGIADLLVEEYFERLKPDLAFRLERAKNYRGYEHADAPYISARVAWEQFLPALTQEWDVLKSQDEPSPETFSHLSNLYQQQASCPPELIRRILAQYAKQATWVKVDPYLQYADMSLFGFHSASDWFGANFVDLSAQFIVNVAKYAELKGYKVTAEEAKADIARNFHQSLEKMGQKDAITLESHLRSLGLTEKNAEEAWRLVLLFRRYFQEVGNATFVDQLPYKEFAAFTKEEFVINKYEWPESLHLKTAEDLISFEVYLNAISGKMNSLSLPKTILPLQTIAEQTPELVQTSYRMNIATVTLDEIGLRAPLKAILDWQLDSNNWDLLVYTFSFLEKTNSDVERFNAIEKLSSVNRGKIDQFARKEWAKKQSDLIVKLLQESPSVEQVVSIAKDWISISEIEKPRELATLIESAANGDCIVKELLERYSEHGTFYRFSNIEKETDTHVLTFQEAKDLGVMNLISDRFLESEYKKIRAKHTSLFQNKEGEWKHFSTVKEEIAKIAFSDLLKKMGTKQTLANYAQHRLEKAANDALIAVQKNAREMDQDENTVLNQFKLVKKPTLIQRTTKDEWMQSQVFTMSPSEWSPVYVPTDGNISFFYFEKKQPSTEPILEQISLGQEVIAADAQRFVAKTMLSKSRLKVPMKEQ